MLIAVALGCIGALVLVVGGGLTVFALTRGGEDPTAAPSTEPTSAPHSHPAPTIPEPVETETAPESDTPSEESAPPTKEGAGFEVIPQIDVPPGDVDDLWAIMADNPLTQGSLPDVTTCDLPATPAEPSTKDLQALLDTASTCLDQVWASASSDRGLPWVTPTVQVYTWPDIPTSASCDADTFAEDFPRVCNLDATIYWPTGFGIGARQSDPAAAPGAYLWDLSYVYMISVAWNSSLGTYYAELEAQLEGDEERGNEAWRRYNLQTLCIASAATMQQPSAAQPAPDVRERLLTESNWATSEGPGALEPSSRVRWLKTGFESGGDLAECNTWNAPAEQVA